MHEQAIQSFTDALESRVYALDPQAKRTPKGWLVHCPQHRDRHPSAMVYDDGWLHCFAGCRRFHILNPDLVQTNPRRDTKEEVLCDYYDEWLELEALDEGIKGIPVSHLNKLGWRKMPVQNKFGTPPGIFIPYFSVSGSRIPFYQVRHTGLDRRFTFAKGCSPVCYNYPALKQGGRFLAVVEGPSDAAVLSLAGARVVGIPSASLDRMVKKMDKWAIANAVTIAWCGDRDTAGDRLMANLEHCFIDLRPPEPYKDYGDVYEAEGIDGVRKYLAPILPTAKEEYKEVWDLMNS